jgi:cell division protein FtsB
MATKQSRTLSARVTARVVASRRRVGTVAAFAIAGLLAYHVVVGNNGINVYKQKLVEDKQLAAEVKQMQQENDRLRKHVDHLASDPDAIEYEAHVRLRYTKPGQVIVLNDGHRGADTTPSK